MARSAFWVVLLVNLYRLAMHGQDMPYHFLWLTLGLLAYVFFSKTHNIRIGPGFNVSIEPKNDPDKPAKKDE
jgi:hypothetical protein